MFDDEDIKDAPPPPPSVPPSNKVVRIGKDMIMKMRVVDLKIELQNREIVPLGLRSALQDLLNEAMTNNTPLLAVAVQSTVISPCGFIITVNWVSL